MSERMIRIHRAAHMRTMVWSSLHPLSSHSAYKGNDTYRHSLTNRFTTGVTTLLLAINSHCSKRLQLRPVVLILLDACQSTEPRLPQRQRNATLWENWLLRAVHALIRRTIDGRFLHWIVRRDADRMPDSVTQRTKYHACNACLQPNKPYTSPLILLHPQIPFKLLFTAQQLTRF